jgi:hypothetical protein
LPIAADEGGAGSDHGRMRNLVTSPWREHLVLSSELPTPGERSRFFAEVRRGEFVAILRGVYVRKDVWSTMDRHARYRARVKAAAALYGEGLVFARESAAAMWRLPSVGPWPDRVHVLEPNAPGGRSSMALARHTVGVPDRTVTIDGLTVTSLERTVVDLARAVSFGGAVTVADAALRRTVHPQQGVPRTFVTREDLLRELDQVPLKQGFVKARRVIEFANGAADRPGESMSRVSMSLAGLPAPQLQATILGASGKAWTVDFWWPEFNLIGEFDGKYKYTDQEFLRGRTPEQAVIDEKLREDDLRAARHGMSRWDWTKAVSPRLLSAHLIAAGLR